MKITNNREFRVATGIKEDLDYFIERLSEDEQDYLDVRALKETQKKIEADVSEYIESQKSLCPTIKVGSIVGIFGGDGISYSQQDYYKISNITDRWIEDDRLTVVRGDYNNEIVFEEKWKESIEKFMNQYNRNYHSSKVPEETWNMLMDYTKNIPWPDYKCEEED